MFILPQPPSLNLQNPLDSLSTPSLPSVSGLPGVQKSPLKRVSGLDYRKTFTETTKLRNLTAPLPSTPNIPSLPVPSVPKFSLPKPTTPEIPSVPSIPTVGVPNLPTMTNLPKPPSINSVPKVPYPNMPPLNNIIKPPFQPPNVSKESTFKVLSGTPDSVQASMIKLNNK